MTNVCNIKMFVSVLVQYIAPKNVSDADMLVYTLFGCLVVWFFLSVFRRKLNVIIIQFEHVCNASGCGTALQAGRLRDRSAMGSLGLLIDLILPATL